MRCSPLLLACGLALPLAAADEVVALTLTPVGPGGGMMGYRNLDFDTKGRSQVVLAGAKAPLAVARTRVGLLIDRNHDGACDAKDEPAITSGQTFSIPVSLGGKEVPYQISVMWMDGTQAFLSSGSVLTGTTAAGVAIRLGDKDLDGTFATAGVDSVALTRPKTQAGPDHCGNLPTDGLSFGTMLAGAGQLWKATYDPAGPSLRLAAWDGPTATASLELTDTTPSDTRTSVAGSSLTLDSPAGLGQVLLTPGLAQPLPAGEWVLGDASLSLRIPATARRKTPLAKALTGGDADVITLSGDNRGRRETIAGKRTFTFGVPQRLAVEALGLEDRVELGAPLLVGANGDSWRAEVDSEKSSLTVFLRTGGQQCTVGKMEYG
jgi:hypothetical protein